MLLSLLEGGIRRIQRVSDVNAMGYTTPQKPNAFVPNTFAAEPPSSSIGGLSSSNPTIGTAASGYGDHQNAYNMNQTPSFAPNYPNQPTSNPYYGAAPYSNVTPQPPPPLIAGPTIFNPTNAPNPEANTFSSQFSMLQQPMVQDMALQYGQRLADQGKQLVETQFEKYVPVTRLKYYFAVDNNYVVRKLILLLFPFTHRVRTVDELLQFYNEIFYNVSSFFFHYFSKIIFFYKGLVIEI